MRLDFIRDIKNDYVDQMTAIRAKFIELDKELCKIQTEANDRGEFNGERVVAVARMNVETALHYAIKSLCILGEVKHVI